MQLIALLSGGKDSVYNVLEAVRLGHTIACAANLHPGAGCGDELDSWMYQTVGWNAVPLIAGALGVPLIRRATSGAALHTGLGYPPARAADPRDEVEDLFALLRDAAAAHPEARGVAVGAILSGYQRARVEAVCARLRLVPVALLWAREQRALLADMARSGLRAALVKVAAHGLTAAAHLGRDVGALRASLNALHASHGLNVCGEGGEYETLALDSPLHVRGTVELTRMTAVEARGGCAHLHVAEAVLRERGGDDVWAAEAARLRRADWRGRGRATSAAGPPFLSPYDAPLPTVAVEDSEGGRDAVAASEAVAARGSAAAAGGCVFVALSAEEAVAAGAAGAAARATRRLLAAANILLRARGSSLHEALFVRLYVSNMACFGEVNGAFARFWEGASHPPARSCLELRVGGGREAGTVEVRMDALCAGGEGGAPPCPRRALHVASLSKWAPLCIGPYCQATTLGGAAVFCAGQIGLVPETMALRGGGLAVQLRQALLNAARVAAAAGGALTGALALQVFHAVGGDGAVEASAAVRAQLEESAARWVLGRFGKGSRRLGGGARSSSGSSDCGIGSDSEGYAPSSNSGSEGRSSDSEGEGAPLVALNERDFPLGADAHNAPPYAAAALAARAPPPLPVVVLPVPALPRGALVEVELLCAHGGALKAVGPIAAQQRLAGHGALCTLTRLHCLPGAVASAWVHVGAVDGAGADTAALLELACGALVEEGARALGGAPALLSAAHAAWHVRVFFPAAAEGVVARDVADAAERVLRGVCGGAAVCVQALPLPALPAAPAPAPPLRALLLAHFTAAKA